MKQNDNDDSIKELQAEIENTIDKVRKDYFHAIINLQYKLLKSNCIYCKKLWNGNPLWVTNVPDILHDQYIYEHKISGFLVCPDCNKLGHLAKYKYPSKRWEWVSYDGSTVIAIK